MAASWQSFAGIPQVSKVIDLVNAKGTLVRDPGGIVRLGIQGKALIGGQLVASDQGWRFQVSNGRST